MKQLIFVSPDSSKALNFTREAAALRITGMLRDSRRCDLSISAGVIQFNFGIKKYGRMIKIPILKTQSKEW